MVQADSGASPSGLRSPDEGSKFTPGPWRIPHFMRLDTKCDCGHIFSDHQDHMGAICTVRFDDRGQEAATRAEAGANARLISAAPDMYEALKQLLMRWVDPLSIRTEHWEVARAALAKADGTLTAPNEAKGDQ